MEGMEGVEVVEDSHADGPIDRLHTETCFFGSVLWRGKDVLWVWKSHLGLLASTLFVILGPDVGIC